jgi:hypothetical protein
MDYIDGIDWNIVLQPRRCFFTGTAAQDEKYQER